MRIQETLCKYLWNGQSLLQVIESYDGDIAEL